VLDLNDEPVIDFIEEAERDFRWVDLELTRTGIPVVVPKDDDDEDGR
jgi:hypothetical protein